jgi:tetratricopeptide (TPR) repeat protein
MTLSAKCALLLLTLPLLLPAQEDGRYSEKEIRSQELFIEANKFRLLGNQEKAIETFQEILKKDRQNHAAAFELARIYAEQNNNSEALNLAKQAVSAQPGNAWYQRFLADMYQRGSMFKEAAAIYEQLTTQNPADEYNYLKWAYFLVQAGQTESALRVYNDLETRTGVNEELSRRKHSLYLGAGDAANAERELLRLCEAFPDNTDYLHLLAGFYRQTGNKESERATLAKILSVEPNDSKAFFALSSIDNPQSGDAAFVQSLEPLFQNPQVGVDEKIKPILPLVQKAAATSDEALAAELLRLASILDRVHPGQAKVCALNGDLLYLSGEKPKALERYKQAVELDETVFTVWEQLFRLAYETGDINALAFYTEKAMDIFPNQAMVYYFNGMAHNLLDAPQDAISSLEQAQLMSGRNNALKAQALAQLAIARQAAGDEAGSDQALQQALQLAPENPGVESAHGRVFYKRKNYAKSGQWLGKALQNGGDQDPPTLEYFGDLQYQLQAVDTAVEYWQKALDLGYTSPRLEKKIADRKLYE